MTLLLASVVMLAFALYWLFANNVRQGYYDVIGSCGDAFHADIPFALSYQDVGQSREQLLAPGSQSLARDMLETCSSGFDRRRQQVGVLSASGIGCLVAAAFITKRRQGLSAAPSER